MLYLLVPECSAQKGFGQFERIEKSILFGNLMIGMAVILNIVKDLPMTINRLIAIQETDPSSSLGGFSTAQDGKLEFFSSEQIIAALKVILLLPFLCFSSSGTHAQSKNLKVISYNILNGFDWGKDTVREQQLITWVDAQQADVVALQELCGFDQEKLAQMARQWGHDHAVILKEEGYPVGITSTQPIELKEKVREGLWHGMLHCRTQGVDFFVVHLSPADWQFRRQEVKIITEKIELVARDHRQYIVLGDFNAHSPFDGDFDLMFPYQRERTRRSDQKNKKYQNLRDGLIDYSVMAAFLSLPLMDVCQRFVPMAERSTFPAPINVGKWMTAEEWPKTKSRLDFILVSPELDQLCAAAYIFNGPATHYLSDHFPVAAEFIW